MKNGKTVVLIIQAEDFDTFANSSQFRSSAPIHG
ncbi:hypothetical protein C8N25_106127 [Algoriphagus antarcticus]|uniref:Uncharacterized protein n=1 Tax=Algoriphagus antarcticus TaxID=238540 RepID=A0A3E0DX67_9BACT|nr:hypothetical protein C8N25_106127 [Algoriphagus antarcticus]